MPCSSQEPLPKKRRGRPTKKKQFSVLVDIA